MLLRHGYGEENILGVYAFFIFSFSTVTTEASSSDRVEQWGRPRGIGAAALAAVVNQRPFQPHFWHTLHLVSSFSLPPPPSPSACLGSLQTDDAWQTAGNKSTHFTPKSRGRPNAASTVRTNATQPQRDQDERVVWRRGWVEEEWELLFSGLLVSCCSCDLIKGDGWAPSQLLSGGTRRFSGGQIRWNNCCIPLCFRRGELCQVTLSDSYFVLKVCQFAGLLLLKVYKSCPSSLVYSHCDFDVSFWNINRTVRVETSCFHVLIFIIRIQWNNLTFVILKILWSFKLSKACSALCLEPATKMLDLSFLLKQGLCWTFQISHLEGDIKRDGLRRQRQHLADGVATSQEWLTSKMAIFHNCVS